MFLYMWRKKESKVTQSCMTLCDPMDCSLPGSSVHGIDQARILEWVAISFSRRSSWSRDWTLVSHIVGRCFTVWATRIDVYSLKKLPLVSVSMHKSMGLTKVSSPDTRENAVWVLGYSINNTRNVVRCHSQWPGAIQRF